MVSYDPVLSSMVSYGPLLSCMVLYGPLWSCMVLSGPVWSSMVLHEISDNYASQHEKALNRIIYHDIEKDGTRYLLLDSISYHKIARDISISNMSCKFDLICYLG